MRAAFTTSPFSYYSIRVSLADQDQGTEGPRHPTNAGDSKPNAIGLTVSFRIDSAELAFPTCGLLHCEMNPQKSTSSIKIILGLTTGSIFLAIALGVVLTSFSEQLTWRVILRDPASTFHASPFVGIISHLGIMTMVVTGCICLFVVSLASVRPASLFLAGLFSVAFSLDDLLMLHEKILPNLFGIPELITFGFYGIIVMILVGFQYADLSQPRGMMLVASVLFFVVSAALDQLAAFDGLSRQLQIAIEDYAKFSGIAFWAGYWISTARDRLLHITEPI